ncbi:MAG TPA: hypothetical protein V6C95_17990 [Coleofasciculaceae cyanobacterium]
MAKGIHKLFTFTQYSLPISVFLGKTGPSQGIEGAFFSIVPSRLCDRYPSGSLSTA